MNIPKTIQLERTLVEFEGIMDVYDTRIGKTVTFETSFWVSPGKLTLDNLVGMSIACLKFERFLIEEFAVGILKPVGLHLRVYDKYSYLSASEDYVTVSVHRKDLVIGYNTLVKHIKRLVV